MRGVKVAVMGECSFFFHQKEPPRSGFSAEMGQPHTSMSPASPSIPRKATIQGSLPPPQRAARVLHNILSISTSREAAKQPWLLQPCGLFLQQSWVWWSSASRPSQGLERSCSI